MGNHNVDAVVIGSGPGGYVCAIRLAQLGFNTICIEKDKLGGVCLNIGCIPSKALLKSAEYMNFLKHSEDYGFSVGDVKVDFPAVTKRSRGVADQMSGGVKYLFSKYKVKTIYGTAKINADKSVSVSDENGANTDTITAKHVIIATGARPRLMPGIEVDKENVWTSTQAMMQQEAPKSLIIMGSGAIGVEFGYFYNAFNTEVTIIEYLDRIVPIEDKDISKELARNFKKSGIKLKTNSKVVAAKKVRNGVEVTIESNGKTEVLKADKALNAIGIMPNTENIGLEEVGIETDRGFIKIDEFMRTNIDGIYAIGDVAGAPYLAHKASAEGITLAEILAGHSDEGINYNTIPGCTYCNPQIASIGMTEEKAKAEGYETKVGKFPFSANGKAHGIGKSMGFVKLVTDKNTGEILGAHMIGPDVTEMIGEVGVAISLEATAETIMKTIHAHPTLSEAVMEAAAVVQGEAVNI